MKDEIKVRNLTQQAIDVLNDLKNLKPGEEYEAGMPVDIMANTLLDYITNLQEENEELREDNFAYHQLMKMQNKREYRSKFLKDFQKEYGENVFPDYDEIYKRYDNYKTRNELAIEYINKNYDTDIEDVFELLEILQGKSDE